MAKVRIEMTGRHRGRIWVDGVEQDSVVAIDFGVDVRRGQDAPGRVTITKAIYPSELEIEGQEIDVTTPASVARTYRLG